MLANHAKLLRINMGMRQINLDQLSTDLHGLDKRVHILHLQADPPQYDLIRFFPMVHPEGFRQHLLIV
jgi:hypothetical protein